MRGYGLCYRHIMWPCGTTSSLRGRIGSGWPRRRSNTLRTRSTKSISSHFSSRQWNDEQARELPSSLNSAAEWTRPLSFACQIASGGKRTRLRISSIPSPSMTTQSLAGMKGHTSQSLKQRAARWEFIWRLPFGRGLSNYMIVLTVFTFFLEQIALQSNRSSSFRMQLGREDIGSSSPAPAEMRSWEGFLFPCQNSPATWYREIFNCC